MRRRTFLLHSPVWAGALAAAPRKLSMAQFTAAGCSLTNLGFEGTLNKIHELGFAGIEIATFVEKDGPEGQTYPYAVVDRLDASERKRLKALVKRFRHVTTHLPYYPDFRPIAADPDLRARSRRELLRSVDDSGFWGASVATVHVASEKDVAFRDARPELIGFYRELGDRAARYGVRLGIETTRPYKVGEYLELIEAVGRENVGGTLDTGHMSFFPDHGVAAAERGTPKGIARYNDLIMEVARGLGSKLFHLHVHDVRASDWKDHYVPGTGIVDWQRLLRHLSDDRYAGLLAAEILYYEGPQEPGLRRAREFFEKLLQCL